MNYSNPDLVGHSGSYSAALKAVEFVDTKIAEVVAAAEQHEYQILITADHGNADHMIYPDTGEQCPSHSYSLVPAILVGPDFEAFTKLNVEAGKEGLATIAPTILKMMNVEIPGAMDGKTLY